MYKVRLLNTASMMYVNSDWMESVNIGWRVRILDGELEY